MSDSSTFPAKFLQTTNISNGDYRIKSVLIEGDFVFFVVDDTLKVCRLSNVNEIIQS